MPRTGENIYKRKDGRWEGRYIKGRINGKAKYGAVYAKSYREVKKKLAAAREGLKREGPAAGSAGKMADIGGKWLSEAAASLKEPSVNKYEDILRCYILPEFGGNELLEITNQQLFDFANRLLLYGGAKGQGLAPATVAEVLSAMNSIRAYALKKDYAVNYSTEGIRLKKGQAGVRVFSQKEEEILIGYLLGHMNPSSLGILLCLFTGIRIGELCALKWDDIHLPEKEMSVGKTLQRLRVGTEGEMKTEVRLLEPKSTSSVRVIPLPDFLVGLLGKFHTSGAFLLSGGSRFVEPRTMQNRFKRILAFCGIQDANFHATRHTFATRCIELGFDVKSLSEILGHASVAITMDRYVHPTMELKRENMNRFSEVFAVR